MNFDPPEAGLKAHCRCVCFRYLEVEWEVRKGAQRSFGKDVMRGSSPRVPQQDNFSDCGVYILQYVESFFEVRARVSEGRVSAPCTLRLRCTNVYPPSLRAEPDSQLPPADEPVGVVPSAADEDEARGDHGAHPEDSGSAGPGQEGVGPGRGSAGLPRGARDRRDMRGERQAAERTHQPLNPPRPPPPGWVGGWTRLYAAGFTLTCLKRSSFPPLTTDHLKICTE